MNPLEIKIDGMSCQHCVASVTKALTAVGGVEKAEVSLENKNAMVWGTADKAALIAAVEKAGFAAG